MSAKRKVEPAPDFEESLKRLEEIVEQLEAGEIPLDRAIELFQEGKTLSKQCGKHLTEIEKKVLKIVEREDGEAALEPFDAPVE